MFFVLFLKNLKYNKNGYFMCVCVNIIVLYYIYLFGVLCCLIFFNGYIEFRGMDMFLFK